MNNKLLSWQDKGEKIIKINEPIMAEGLPACVGNTKSLFFLFGWAKTTGSADPFSILDMCNVPYQEDKKEDILDFWNMCPRVPSTLFLETFGKDYHAKYCSVECDYIMSDTPINRLGMAIYDIDYLQEQHKYVIYFFSQPSIYEPGQIVRYSITEDNIYTAHEKALNTEVQNKPDKIINKMYFGVFGDYPSKSIPFFDSAQFYDRYITKFARKTDVRSIRDKILEAIDQYVKKFVIPHSNDISFSTPIFWESKYIYLNTLAFKKYLKSEQITGIRIPSDLKGLVVDPQMRFERKIKKDNKEYNIDTYTIVINKSLYNDVKCLDPGEVASIDDLQAFDSMF